MDPKYQPSEDHQRLLTHLGTNYKTGRLRNLNVATRLITDSPNVLLAPIHCPAWACILLPCIPYLVPSLGLFQHIEPKEADVLVTRYNNSTNKSISSWICYDASSIRVGDVVRLSQGDIVVGDIVALTLLPNHPQTTCILDYEKVTGQARPLILTQEDITSSILYLYCGATVIQGSLIAVVVAVGRDSITSQLIQHGLWPPQYGEDLASWVEIQSREDGSVQGIVGSHPPFSPRQRLLRRLGYSTRSTKRKADEEKQALSIV